ncbi:DUF6159 family protein [Nitrospira sp. KM1]|uniref:DUF6159 family protein n=1 Tax=Nitrospira sp. KM1 TaxID=1936990 RepID=UPI00156687A5|nr:DUF6159 family protein [Nitrospira sp. KM1]
MGSWSQRLARTQAIMSAAWQILRADPALLIFPIMSSVCLLLLAALWAFPALMNLLMDGSARQTTPSNDVPSYVGLFVFYVVTYGAGVFFNAALASCVLRRLAGKPSSVLDGLRDALSCTVQILGWAVIAATVGTVLKALERRSGFLGGMVVRMIGLAWSVATFLVVPILVAERKGPVEAVEESVALLRRTWGENLLSGIGFGLLSFLWAIPGAFVLVVGAGMIPSRPVAAMVVMALALLYFPSLWLILSTMSTIFDVVLYRYARLGMVTPGFDRELLESSFVKKPA